MASTEHSSVAFSVRQLLDAENQRVSAETAEQQAKIARERERRLRSSEQERLQAEQPPNRQHEHEWHQRLTQEANLLKARLMRESEAAIAAIRGQLEQEHQLRAIQHDARLSVVTGRQRIVMAALVTLLVGAGLCWFLVVLPGQRQASASYAALSDLYAKLLNEQRERSDAWSRERRQLKSQLESSLTQHASSIRPTAPTDKTGSTHTALPAHPRPGATKPPCTCLRGDPLCDC